MTGRLRVGLIGCGGIARAHVADYYHRDTALGTVTAVADPDQAAASSMGASCGLTRGRIFGSAGDLLSDGQVDLLDVCTPPGQHAEVIMMAVESGTPVICEKPLATDYATAEAAIQRGVERGVHVGVMQNYRWRPEYAAAHALTATGRIGEISLASITGLFHWYGGAPYRLNAERMMFLEMGYHYVDLIRYLIGSEITNVYATVERSKSAPARGDTYGIAVLKFRSGATGHILISGECQGRRTYWGGRAAIQAEEGNIYLNDPEPGTLTAYSSRLGGLVSRRFPDSAYSMSGNVLFGAPLDEYLRAATEEREFPVTGSDNLHVLEAVLACYDSAEQDRPVSLGGTKDGTDGTPLPGQGGSIHH